MLPSQSPHKLNLASIGSHSYHTQTAALAQSSTQSTSASAALLKDDYNVIDLDSMKRWRASGAFQLECGLSLHEPCVCYQTYGQLNAAGDNAIIVCHALTGHADVRDWWGSLFGANNPLDVDKYFIVCANLLGSCYGSTGPTSIDPLTQVPYGANFPVVTIRDSVRLHKRLMMEHLHIRRVACVIGGSLGGMQALEWCLIAPELIQSASALACNARHSAWQIAINHVQRQAIFSDPAYNHGKYTVEQPPNQGLSLARQIAMISYRTHPVYESKFGRDVSDEVTARHAAQLSPPFQVERYLLYQGNKILSRFDANSYVRLTQVLDSHDLGRNRNDGSCEAALASITQPVLIIGVESDLLYPMHEQEALASKLPNATFQAVQSMEGHDGFLLEQSQINLHLRDFMSHFAQPVSTRAHLQSKL